MKVFLFALLFSVSAFAKKAEMNFSHLVGLHDDQRIEVSLTEEGLVRIFGYKIGETVSEAKVLRDMRPVDGPLMMKIGNFELSVGSGRTVDQNVSYMLKIDGQWVELKPVVYFRLLKDN